MKLFLALLFSLSAFAAETNYLGTLSLYNRLAWDNPNTNRTDFLGFNLYVNRRNGTNLLRETVVQSNTNELSGFALSTLLSPGIKVCTLTARVVGEIESEQSAPFSFTFDPSPVQPPFNVRIISADIVLRVTQGTNGP